MELDAGVLRDLNQGVERKLLTSANVRQAAWGPVFALDVSAREHDHWFEQLYP